MGANESFKNTSSIESGKGEPKDARITDAYKSMSKPSSMNWGYNNSNSESAQIFSRGFTSKHLDRDKNNNSAFQAAIIDELFLKAKDISSEEVSRYKEIKKEAAQFKGEGKDIIIRNIEKEHREVNEKFLEINNLMRLGSKINLQKLRDEIENLENEAEQIHEYGDLSTDSGDLLKLYSEFKEIIKNPESKTVSEIEEIIDIVNHQLSLLHFAKGNFLYDKAIEVVSKFGNSLFGTIVDDGLRTQKDLEDFEELPPLEKIRSARNLLCDIVINKKKKEISGDTFESESKEYGKTINGVKMFEEKLKNISDIKLISYPELNGYINYLKETGQLTREKINSVFSEKRIKEITKLWNDSSTVEHWDINDMSDFQLGLAEIYVISDLYKKHEGVSKLMKKNLVDKILKDERYLAMKQKLTLDAMDYFKEGNEKLGKSELEQIYINVFNVKAEDVLKKEQLRNIIKFPDNIPEENREEYTNDIVEIISKQLKNVENDESKINPFKKIANYTNLAIREINDKYAKDGIKMAEVDSKSIALQSVEFQINNTKQLIGDLNMDILWYESLGKELTKKRKEIIQKRHNGENTSEEEKEIREIEKKLNKLNGIKLEREKLLEVSKQNERLKEYLEGLSNEEIDNVSKKISEGNIEEVDKEVMLIAYLKEVESGNVENFYSNLIQNNKEEQQITNQEKGINNTTEKNNDVENNSVKEFVSNNNDITYVKGDNDIGEIETKHGTKAEMETNEDGSFKIKVGIAEETFNEPEEVLSYLKIVDVFGFLGMEKFAEHILGTIKQNNKRFVHSDFSDGISGNEFKNILRDICTCLKLDHKKYEGKGNQRACELIRSDILNSSEGGTITGKTDELLSANFKKNTDGSYSVESVNKGYEKLKEELIKNGTESSTYSGGDVGGDA